jgi:hypothetical protein
LQNGYDLTWLAANRVFFDREGGKTMIALSSIFGFISKPLDTVLKKLLPDKTQREKLKHELEMELIRLPAQERMAFEKRIQLEIEHPNWFRDAVRPLITYCAWLFYMVYKFITLWIMTKAYLPVLDKLSSGTPDQVYTNIDKIKAMLGEYAENIFTDADLYILLTILGFWFGSKMFERIIDTSGRVGGIRTFFGMAGKASGQEKSAE